MAERSGGGCGRRSNRLRGGNRRMPRPRPNRYKMVARMGDACKRNPTRQGPTQIRGWKTKRTVSVVRGDLQAGMWRHAADNSLLEILTTKEKAMAKLNSRSYFPITK